MSNARDPLRDYRIDDLQEQLTPAGPPYPPLRDASIKAFQKLQTRCSEHIQELRDLWLEAFALREHLPKRYQSAAFLDAGSCITMPSAIASEMFKVVGKEEVDKALLKHDAVRKMINTLKTRGGRYLFNVRTLWEIIESQRGASSELVYCDIGHIMMLHHLDVVEIIRRLYEKIDNGDIVHSETTRTQLAIIQTPTDHTPANEPSRVGDWQCAACEGWNRTYWNECRASRWCSARKATDTKHVHTYDSGDLPWVNYNFAITNTVKQRYNGK